MPEKKLTVKSNPVFLDRLPEGAKAVAIKKDIVVNRKVSGTARKAKYKKQKFIQFYDGYDFLQNMIVVRQYIQKRYKIDYHLFELLLYMFPMQYFTRNDYKVIPRQYRYRRISDIMKTGYVNMAVEGRNHGEHIYTLSRQATEIVKMTYECLSGERKMQEIPQHNPMALASANKMSKNQLDLIKILNRKEIPDSKKNMI